MVGTRRSAAMNTQSSLDPARKRNKRMPENTISGGIQRRLCIAQISANLLSTCFSRLNPHIWYSVLPSNDGIADISSETRQKWENILPLLIHSHLLKKDVECDVCIIQ